jgi:hypothetical protein
MLRRIAVLTSLVLGACASTMKTPPSTPSPAQPAAATKAVGAATSVAPVAAPAAPDSEVARWAKAHDYFRTTVGQRVLWCKEESTTGSRIPQRTCLTEANLAMMRRVNEQNKEALLNSANGCPNATCTKGTP